MSTSLHKDLLAAEVHQPFSYEYANAAARTGASGFVAADVYKLAVQTDNDTVWMLTSTAPTWKQIDGGGVAPTWYEDEFTPTNGQVTFIISSTPTDVQSLTFAVNGVLADEGVDYSVSGTTITWTDAPFTMQTSDLVVVRYR